MSSGQDFDVLRGWLESAQRREVRLLSLLRDAQTEVDTIESRFAQLEVWGYPINRLPNELLITIFILFVQDLDQDDVEGEHKLCHWRPVVLSHVSHQWRVLALSTSCLWSSIVLSKASRVSAVDHFMAHAGTSAIDIFASGINDNQLTQHAALVSSEYLPRWRTVAITTSGPSPMVALLQSLYEPVMFTRLSTLKLSLVLPCHHEGTPFHSLLPHPDDRFPALRHVQLVEVPVCSVPIGIFRNIHTLELSNPKQDSNPLTRLHPSLLNVLSTSGCLERLILSDFTPFIDHRTDPVGGGNESPTVILPLLQEFIWYYPEVRVLRHFFSHVSIPHLRNADFSAKRNKGISHGVTPFAFHFPFVNDLTIECDTQETLYCATREMEFPRIKCLAIQTSTDVWDPTSPLPVFRWSAIFRDLRVPHLAHLTLFRLSIALDHVGGVFQYMPSLKSLTCDMCDGVASLVCALGAGDCACAVGGTLREDHGPLELESLTIRDCEGLRIGCLRRWISARNGDEELWRSTVSCIRNRSMARRKIKPLSGKYRRRLQGQDPTLMPSVDESLDTPTATCYIPNYLRQPSKIRFISFDNCGGITEANALELRQLGVDTVEWN